MKSKFDVFFWIGLSYTTIPVFLLVIASSVIVGIYDIKDINHKIRKKEVYVEPQQPIVVGEVKTKEVTPTPKPVVVNTPKPKVVEQDTVKVNVELTEEVTDTTKKSE
jgi:hypothetical protein